MIELKKMAHKALELFVCQEEYDILWDYLTEWTNTVHEVREPGLSLTFGTFGSDLCLAIRTERPLKGRTLNFVTAEDTEELIEKAKEEYGIAFDVCQTCGRPILGGFTDESTGFCSCTHCMSETMDSSFHRWKLVNVLGSGSDLRFVSRDWRGKYTVEKIRYQKFNESRAFCS